MQCCSCMFLLVLQLPHLICWGLSFLFVCALAQALDLCLDTATSRAQLAAPFYCKSLQTLFHFCRHQCNRLGCLTGPLDAPACLSQCVLCILSTVNATSLAGSHQLTLRALVKCKVVFAMEYEKEAVLHDAAGSVDAYRVMT